MSFLNIAGGIARGYNESVNDEYRRQEQEFLKSQRARLQKTQAEEDEVKAGLKRIKPAGTYQEEIEVEDRGAPGDGALGITKTKKTVQRTRKESDVARDTAAFYQSQGMADKAAELSDRAYSLGEREYKDSAWKLIRNGMGMSLRDYASAAANLKTALNDNVNAFVQETPDGALVASVYNQNGELVQVPVTTHQQITDLLTASMGPEYMMQVRKGLREDASLRPQYETARAQTIRANAAADETKAKLDAGFYPALAGNYDAQARQHDAMAKIGIPARAAADRAEAALRQKQGQELSLRIKQIEEDAKLPEGARMYLGMLRDQAIAMQKAAATDPSYVAAAKIATARVIRGFQQVDQSGRLAGINAWEAAGLPTPEQAAQSFIEQNRDKLNSAKTAPELIEQEVQKAQMLGPEYAKEFRDAIGKLFTPYLPPGGRANQNAGGFWPGMGTFSEQPIPKYPPDPRKVNEAGKKFGGER